MNIRNKLTLTTIIGIELVLTGCSPILSPQDPFPVDHKTGYVAFSTACNSGYPDQTLTLCYTKWTKSRWNRSGCSSVNLICTDHSLQYFIVKLPPQNYRIYEISSHLGPMVTDAKFKKTFAFTSTAGKVNYVGRFYFEYLKNDTVWVGLKNMSKIDLPVLRSHYQNIPNSAFSIKLAHDFIGEL